MSKNITSFLNTKIFSFKEYQRAFEWELENIVSFWKSLLEKLYTGNITYKNTNDTKEKREILEIIDGQQRLTSLGIIFGGKIEKIYFNFNVDSTTDNKILNGILNGESKESQVSNSTDGYSKRIYDLKIKFNEWLEKEYDGEKEIEIKINEAYKNINLLAVEILVDKVEESFIALNNNGVQLDALDILKTKTVINNPDKKEEVIKEWSKFLSVYYDILKDSNGRIPKYILANQSLTAEKGKITIISKKNIQEEIVNLNTFKNIYKYSVWAKGIIPMKEESISKDDFISSYTFQAKVLPFSPSISFLISKKNCDNDQKFYIFILFATFNNLFSMTDTNSKEYEIFIKIFLTHKKTKKIIEFLTNEIKKILKNKHDEIINNLNGQKKITLFSTDTKNRNGKNRKYSLKGPLTRKYIFLIDFFYSTLKNKKLPFSEMPKNISKKFSELTIEHLLGLNYNNFEYYTIVSKKTNNKLDKINKSKISFAQKKEKIIEELKKEQTKYPFFSYLSYNSLRKAIEIYKKSNSIIELKKNFRTYKFQK